MKKNSDQIVSKIIEGIKNVEIDIINIAKDTKNIENIYFINHYHMKFL